MLKKLCILLILGVVISFVINRVYEVYMRPDSLFFQKCLQTTKEWEEEVRNESSACYVFSGGSEVRMNIEPLSMKEAHNIAAINAGTQAQNGVRCNAQLALDFIRKGDTLVISGPRGSSILKDDGCSHAGVNFCYTQKGLGIFTQGIIPPSAIISLFQGDALNYSIHAMRLLTRPDCIYRYSSPQNARISKSGRVEVLLTSEQGQRPADVDGQEDIVLDGWEELINDLRAECENKGARLIMYIGREHASINQRKAAAKVALYFTQLGIPVIRDPYLGAWEDAKMFSDFSLHLSVEGGKQHSAFLAECLKYEEFWSVEELTRIIDAH